MDGTRADEIAEQPPPGLMPNGELNEVRRDKDGKYVPAKQKKTDESGPALVIPTKKKAT
jgi:hypothetical protein